ncbi:patatin-like protein [Kitasatospora griseola]
MAVKEEVRLALVMNGGVSLAVWMGGVTHELDLLRRASADEPDESLSPSEREVAEIWRQITDATGANARVVIDIVSGTSAGGLNGLLLATAIGRGSELGSLREVWEAAASLPELLKSPSRQSLLDGTYFEKRIRAQLEDMPEAESPEQPISLFMTATSLGGRARNFKDGFGSRFDVRDHRRVYRFQYDKHAEVFRKQDDGTMGFELDSRCDFCTVNNDALVQAARASAGFPVAFPPVDEQPMVHFRELPAPAADAPASCVIDGGVLNNAPFGPVLEAITERQLDERVRRVVVYVTPSVGLETVNTAGQSACGDVPFVTSALNALQYPREADFRSGTQELSTRLGTSVRGTQLSLFDRMSKEKDLRDYVRDAAETMLGEYRLSRASAVLWETRQRLAEVGTVTELVAVPEADPDELGRILGENPNWSPQWPSQDINSPDMSQWRWGLITAERLFETLGGYLQQYLDSKDLHADPDGQRALLDGATDISRQQRRALAVAKAVRHRIRDQYRPGLELSNLELGGLLGRVFDDLDVPATIGGLVAKACSRFAEATRQAGLGHWKGLGDVVHDCLAVEVVTRMYAPPSKAAGPLTPAFEFLRLGPDSMSPVFNVDRFADLGDRKLYGIRFQHFGAFINREWRRSDFIWGRLDAAHHLLFLLVPSREERLAWEEKLHLAILEAETREHAAETSAKDQLGHNLEELRTTRDTELLGRILETEQGEAGLRAVICSATALLGNTDRDEAAAASAAAGPQWRKVLAVTRPLVATDPKAVQKADKRWLRWVTWYVRLRACRALDKKDPRTIPRVVKRALTVSVVACVLILIGIGIAIGLAVG